MWLKRITPTAVWRIGSKDWTGHRQRVGMNQMPFTPCFWGPPAGAWVMAAYVRIARVCFWNSE